MKYKAIICDLDGTLLNSKHQFSENTINSIRKINNEGIKVYIATGRHYLDAKKFREILGVDTFLISSNGAKVHNNMDKEIFSYEIPNEIIRELLTLNIDEEIQKNIFTNNGWYVEKVPINSEEAHHISGFSYNIVSSFNDLKDEKIIKVFFISDNLEKMSQFYNCIPKELKNSISMGLPSNYLEIMKRGVSKGEIIIKMLELDGITPEETIAFGDGLNDLEMLSIVKQGYIMGNANKKLKKLLPDCEIIDTNDEDGVAKKIMELFNYNLDEYRILTRKDSNLLKIK